MELSMTAEKTYLLRFCGIFFLFKVKFSSIGFSFHLETDNDKLSDPMKFV